MNQEVFNLSSASAKPAGRWQRWVKYPCWRGYAYGWFGAERLFGRKQNRFILLCRPRSGSHFLMSLLRQHPDIFFDEEQQIFHKKNFRVKYPLAYLSGLSMRSGARVYGCKTHINRMLIQGHDIQQILEKLHRNQWKYIYVYRKDILRQAISHIIAKHRDVTYDLSDNGLNGYQIAIQPEYLFREMKKSEQHLQAELEFLKPYPCLYLEYGESILHRDKHANMLSQFSKYVGVRDIKIDSPIRKTAPKDLSKIIVNYDELVTSVAGSDYCQYLDSNGRI